MADEPGLTHFLTREPGMCQTNEPGLTHFLTRGLTHFQTKEKIIIYTGVESWELAVSTMKFVQWC